MWWVTGGYAAASVGWWALLLWRGRDAGAALRALATLGWIAAGALGTGPLGWRAVPGAVGGYAVAHTAGWLADRVRRPAGRRFTAPDGARRYRLRTTTLSGSTVAGAAFGLGVAGALIAGTLLVDSAIARRWFLGGPLLVALPVVVAVVAVLVLRRWVLSDVEVELGAAVLLIRARRRGHPWTTARYALSDVRIVDRFVDPYGVSQRLRVDAGTAGRFELRAAGALSGRSARAAIARLGADLLGRLNTDRSTAVRPYVARWGTWRYRVDRSLRSAE